MQGVDVPWRKLQPLKCPCWSRLLTGVEPTQEQAFYQKLQPMGQSIPETCGPCEEPTLKQFLKNCLLWEGLDTAAREEHIEEGGSKCYGQTAFPARIPCSLV